MEESIINNHIQTGLPYDILEMYFSTHKITVEDAHHLILPSTIKPDKGLVLFGAGPIWLYLILYKKIKELNAAAWIAQFDSRMASAVRIDDITGNNLIIPFDEFSGYIPVPKNNMVVAFIGPPHSGKTVFMYTLFNMLLAVNPVFVYRNFFVIKGCPDGEAHWSVNMPETLLKQFRIKREFTEEFVADVLNQIKNIVKFRKIIFVDCGGKADDYNKQILSKCTHAIVVSADKKETTKWQQAFPDITYLAVVDSYLSDKFPGKSSRIISTRKGTFYLEMVDLERGNESVSIPDKFVHYFIKA